MPQKIYMIAVGGMGMGTLAGLLKEKGFEVSGSDLEIYPPMSDQLKALGIESKKGYRRANVPNPPPDWVIVGNAVSKTNEEVLEVLERKIPYLSMPQAVGKFFLEGRRSLVVAGTHGKTTTSSLLSWILESAGRSPGFLVGGILKNFGKSCQLGRGDEFVVEGDEYDSAFFDKGPKFLHYRPQGLILNAVEFDHADIYKNLDEIMAAFAKLVALVPEDGLIVADGDNANVRTLVARARCRVKFVSVEEKSSSKKEAEGILTAVDVALGEKTKFRFFADGKDFGIFESPLVGLHNLKNLLAVMGLALDRGVTPDRIRQALPEFQGVKRRQEVLGTFGGVAVIDDFAHHPTAVVETLKALRAKYGSRKIWAVFEPRSNTTRRKVFQKDFITAFAPADEIVFAAPYLSEKIPEEERLDPGALVADLNRQGKKTRYIPSVDEIVTTLKSESREGDVICLMSNGGFGGIRTKLTAALG